MLFKVRLQEMEIGKCFKQSVKNGDAPECSTRFDHKADEQTSIDTMRWGLALGSSMNQFVLNSGVVKLRP